MFINRIINLVYEIPIKFFSVMLLYLAILQEIDSDYILIYLYMPLVIVTVSGGLSVAAYRFFNSINWKVNFFRVLYLWFILFIVFFIYPFENQGVIYKILFGLSVFSFLFVSRILADYHRYKSCSARKEDVFMLVIHLFMALVTFVYYGNFNHYVLIEEYIYIPYFFSSIVLIYVLAKKIGINVNFIKLNKTFDINKTSLLLILSLFSSYGVRNIDKLIFIENDFFYQFIAYFVFIGYLQGFVSQFISFIIPKLFNRHEHDKDTKIEYKHYLSALIFYWLTIFIILNYFSPDKELYIYGSIIAMFFVNGVVAFISNLMNFTDTSILVKVKLSIISCVFSLLFIKLLSLDEIGLTIYQNLYGFILLILILSYSRVRNNFFQR